VADRSSRVPSSHAETPVAAPRMVVLLQRLSNRVGLLILFETAYGHHEETPFSV